MRLLKRLFAASSNPRDALRPLWHAIVAEGRQPRWYAQGRVADTVEGRFDMISAVLAGVLLRMEASSALMPQSALLTELFVADMDGQLRELGVGDVVVGKHIGKLMSAMGGRVGAYREGLAGDDAALAEAVRRNVTFAEGGDADLVASDLRSWAQRLARTPDDALLAGEIAA